MEIIHDMPNQTAVQHAPANIRRRGTQDGDKHIGDTPEVIMLVKLDRSTALNNTADVHDYAGKLANA
eukprot:1426006-Lingulodinium_polyedra.AAC.1